MRSWGFREQERVLDKASDYLLINGKLYRDNDLYLLEVVGPTQRLPLLSKIHEDSGHVGTRRLFESCRRSYYWPYLLEDCAKTVRRCIAC